MSKADVLALGREQGINTALRVIEQACGKDNDAYRALERELRFRRGSGVNTNMTKPELEKASSKIKEYTVQSMLAMALLILWEQYGLEYEQLSRFKEEFDLHAKALVNNEIDWLDILDSLKATTGIELIMPEELIQQGGKYA